MKISRRDSQYRVPPRIVQTQVMDSQSGNGMVQSLTWWMTSGHSWLHLKLACRRRIEARAAIQRARDEIRRQLRHNPLGRLVWNGVMLFGKLQKVVIETFRNEDPDCPPETLLEPSRSFVSDELFNLCETVWLI
ncbi:hypothetical protein V1521DRAFT_422642 [Lipomyces starkeyi]